MTYQSKILDHLGLVAAMFDELELGSLIDQAVPQDFARRGVTVGQAVKALVLNGLGFVNQRLYLVPHFFETKPTEHLLGPGILPEHLNDDTLGRALDSLYDYGVTELFRDLAAHAAAKLDLASRFAHLDATSFHVDGIYNSQDEAPEEGVIHIRQGYSRDHRPELNQVVLEMMVEHKAGLPVLMQPLSGNSSDQGDFPRLIEQHLGHLQQAHGFTYLVADAALYSANHIGALDARGTKFVTRVPETIKQARALIAATDLEAMVPVSEGYRVQVHRSDYGGVAQRWLVFFSEQAQDRAHKSVARHLEREVKQERKAFVKLTDRVFACRKDAEGALAAFAATLKSTTCEAVEILECEHLGLGQEQPQTPMSYRLRGELRAHSGREAELLARKRLFILATNELDEAQLPPEEVLLGYKGQARVERGFRFLKDPLFLASSLFLKNEKRIMALLMVMTLCLLVYAALEWRIREGLRRQGQYFLDQKGKPYQRPTARWVFHCFVGIHVLWVAQQQIVLNLTEQHEVILDTLGQNYRQLYASPPT
jgi:transposase